MQNPLLEMSGLKRVRYIPELTYFYNFYENNDG